jgi:holliday junction DNA helicase RuvB
LVVGQGASARSVRLPVSPFTLVGATTRLSSLSRPFLSRFGIQERLSFYDSKSLVQIVQRTAKILNIKLSEQGAESLVLRSRGTPRVCNRLLKRVWDFAIVQNKKQIDQELVEYALQRLDIDACGLDLTDRNILKVIAEQYKGGPVGIETIAVTLGEERSTIEDVYEPFLVHSGFISRGPRGRSLTDKGKKILTSI